MATKKVKEVSSLVTFEAPPASKGGRAESPRNREIADALRANPGEWAKVAASEKNDGLAVRIRTGKAKSFADGKWEATSRRNEDDTIDIYARFVGDA